MDYLVGKHEYSYAGRGLIWYDIVDDPCFSH